MYKKPNVQSMDKKKARILIIAEELEYDRTSCGLLNTKMTEVLSQHFAVHLLVGGRVGQPIFELPLASIEQVKLQQPTGWKLLGKVPLLRSLPEKLTGFNHASYYKLQQWTKAIKHKLAKDSYDLVLLLGSGMGWYAHMAFSNLLPYAGKFVISIHDPFPMAMLPEPYNVPIDNGQRQLMKRFNHLVEQAAGCYAPSLRLIEHLSPAYPALAGKAVVVPHLAYQLPFLLQPANPPAEKQVALLAKIQPLNGSTHFLLVHMGTLLEGRSPGYFIRAMLQFLEAHPEAEAHTQVVFIGQVHPKLLPEFDPAANHKNFIIENNTRLTYGQALVLQKAAAANLVIESATYHSPQLFGKFADAVMADKPILCIGPATSEARRVVGNDYPYQATNGNEEEIRLMIETLYRNWREQSNQTLQRPDLQHAFHPQRLVDAINSWL